MCREKAPDAVVILMAITPRNDNPAAMPVIEKANERLARLADGKKVRYLSINDKLADRDGKLLEGMSPDRLHLSEKGYQVWATREAGPDGTPRPAGEGGPGPAPDRRPECGRPDCPEEMTGDSRPSRPGSVFTRSRASAPAAGRGRAGQRRPGPAG